ncbi:type II toxin-antitoxin system RelE/ParE family toxin [Micromonospora sp. NPDC051300]|uniref:type II toxin-antitoxin system RelE/ParE family toxin n=1 Tax=Micromonospora sp. NPDC051300 TaxID=3364286 RepID=UPI0037973F74
MSAKRGDRAAPPPRPGGYTIRFATNDAAKGWEELCRQAAANTRAAFDAMETDPCPMPPTIRQHPLKGSLAVGVHNRQALPQWQYEVTAGGRVWYLVDNDRRICWIRHAGTGHPRLTD